MAAGAIKKRQEYRRYADLELVRLADSQDARIIQREMAAEWLKLANTVGHASIPQMK